LELPRIVSQDEWLTARKALLVQEKEHMRAGDRLSAERRALPWVKVEKVYVFDAPDGKVSLADLEAVSTTTSGRSPTTPATTARNCPASAGSTKIMTGRSSVPTSTFARGLDALLGGNHYLDLTPKGRCEADFPNWPRRNDEYEGGRRSAAA
jgi:predicted dithiol-disulfide oxidoreductase (DUF899 family)